MENTNRGVFTLSGVSGLLIATALLLGILGVLSYYAIIIQQDVAQSPYEIKNALDIKMKSKQNQEHLIIKE